MAWSPGNGVFYGGTRPRPQHPDLRPNLTLLYQLNPALQSTTGAAYDPLAQYRAKNTQSQIAVELARQSRTPIMLDAAGNVREAGDQALDTRLVRVLRGRQPRSRTQLDRWLQAIDSTLSPAQRMAMSMQYEARFGTLPNTHPGDDADEDDVDEAMTFPPGVTRADGATEARRRVQAAVLRNLEGVAELLRRGRR